MDYLIVQLEFIRDKLIERRRITRSNVINVITDAIIRLSKEKNCDDCQKNNKNDKE